jgi:uncharacterized protein (UPF0210 family)
MKIRSITCFYDPSLPAAEKALETLAHASQLLELALRENGFEVQTRRLATTPFSLWLPLHNPDYAQDMIKRVEDNARRHDFHYLSIGPAPLDALSATYDLIPHFLACAQTIFCAGKIADKRRGISPKAIHGVAQVIQRASHVTPDGFANLRFAALANVKPGAPFFPAAYHAPGQLPALALAIECADDVLDTFTKAHTLSKARKNLLNLLEGQAARLQEIVLSVIPSSPHFLGFDFSPAPFPETWCSIGLALERLGLTRLGQIGSLSAATFLAETLDRGRWLRTGFNGLMLPVLEDPCLAQRAAEGTLTLKDLLLFSAVCGTGLDTVPLPGETTEDQLVALLSDVAFLSLRLNKPLTARLMPIPGKKAGDAIAFNFAYFAPGGIMELPALPLQGLLNSDELIRIHAR